MTYPKRLIEVDLPIARISKHARKEKSIRHGHISTLHIWWARRPLAACRAVICAALWPDPADPLCPEAFRQTAREQMLLWVRDHDYISKLSEESHIRFLALRQDEKKLWDNVELRKALLDFIADFADWKNSTVKEYLETSRTLTQSAHEALGGAPGTRPLVVDPFAGGGSIPLEALRVGADAFASDLNPVAVLLNKVVLEYIPKYGQRLADEVRKWGEWIKKEAEKELAEFYPKDPDGATPIAYLWARTIRCEGPGCGAEVPLIRSLWLAKKKKRYIALQLLPNPKTKRVDFQIIVKRQINWVNQDDTKQIIASPKFDGTVKRGSVTCPCCGYTTPVARVREQFKAKRGGVDDARLMCLVTTSCSRQGRFYRLPLQQDIHTAQAASAELQKREFNHHHNISLIPNELISLNEIRRISVPLYGIEKWEHCFSRRQALCLVTLFRLADEYNRSSNKKNKEELSNVIYTCISLIIDKLTQYNSSLCRWKASGENLVDTFGRQALPMVWDFAEANPFAGASGDFMSLLEWHVESHEAILNGATSGKGTADLASATSHPYPDDSVNYFITDPPYYDAIPYAYLSDFFYVWLRRSIGKIYGNFFISPEVAKEKEIVVDRPHTLSTSNKDITFYESELAKAFFEGRRVIRPDGVGTIVFASKTTVSWEAILKAVIDAGWIITGSWPIDTEMETRVAAQGQARLASSVHLVCRPRENTDGSIRTEDIGDWRDVLAELPRRIHEWMPRLAEEGVVGADAIFACLGPALEIFSRYSRVEKASGEVVTLKEYLEHVWAAVAKEAISVIFQDADTAGLEPDARLTAMWLWTLGASSSVQDASSEADDEDEESDEAESGKKSKPSGLVLEFDAARKIAQGLGVHLDKIPTIVAVKGETARLLPVADRMTYLFPKENPLSYTAPKLRKAKSVQKTLFDVAKKEGEVKDTEWGDIKAPVLGQSVLDRLHQAMILFAAGRSEAIRRFLVDDGVGTDSTFWKLAQSLSALYPSGSDEKRWVDGVLARKKGLNL